MSKFTNEKGVSLVEVIVSVCVMGIFIIPIMGLLNTNIKINMKSREQLIATSLAENEIEKLRVNSGIENGITVTTHDDFVITSVINTLNNADDNVLSKKIDIYKIVVEVKREDKLIEKIETYKNSIKVEKEYE